MSQGVPLKTISDLMGHASIEVTADIYLHSMDVHVRDTAHMVERALGRAAGRAEETGCCPTCGRPLSSMHPQLGANARSADGLIATAQVGESDL